MLNKFMQEVHGTVVSVPVGDKLNVRAQPDAGSDVLTKVDDGAVLTVLGEEMNGETKWLMVTAGDKTGWVNASYVKITDAECKGGNDMSRDQKMWALIWAFFVAAVLFVFIFVKPARSQAPDPTQCPAGAVSCKIVVMTPEEEQTLAGPEMIWDHAVWANRAKFTDLVVAWRSKLLNAPPGIVQPEPDKKP